MKDPVSGFSHLAGLGVALIAVPGLLLYARGESDRRRDVMSSAA
jgi:hypothetical protein